MAEGISYSILAEKSSPWAQFTMRPSPRRSNGVSARIELASRRNPFPNKAPGKTKLFEHRLLVSAFVCRPQLRAPVLRQSHRFYGGETQDAIVAEKVAVGAQGVTTHRDREILRTKDDRNQPFRIARCAENLRRLPERHQVVQRAAARHTIGEAADVLLKLAGRNARMLIQIPLHVGLGETRFGDGLRNDR